MCLGLCGCNEKNTEDDFIDKIQSFFSDDNSVLDGEYTIYLKFDYKENLFFAKDDLDIYVNDIFCYTAVQGKTNINLTQENIRLKLKAECFIMTK